ncbi:MAG: acyl carrier protein [Candidatus Korobacteraceae bacterium]
MTTNTTHDVEVLSRIRSFISQTFPLARRRKLTDDDNLLTSGVIDSLGVLEIVTLLQQEYSLEVNDEELTPENFESVRSIAQFVNQRLQSRQMSLPG